MTTGAGFAAFYDAIRDDRRSWKLSYEALRALFEHYGTAGDGVEDLDATDICCDWFEYDNDKIRKNYGFLTDECGDKDNGRSLGAVVKEESEQEKAEKVSRAVDAIREHGRVIDVGGGIWLIANEFFTS